MLNKTLVIDNSSLSSHSFRKRDPVDFDRSIVKNVMTITIHCEDCVDNPHSSLDYSNFVHYGHCDRHLYHIKR